MLEIEELEQQERQKAAKMKWGANVFSQMDGLMAEQYETQGKKLDVHSKNIQEQIILKERTFAAGVQSPLDMEIEFLKAQLEEKLAKTKALHGDPEQKRRELDQAQAYQAEIKNQLQQSV